MTEPCGQSLMGDQLPHPPLKSVQFTVGANNLPHILDRLPQRIPFKVRPEIFSRQRPAVHS